MRCPSCEAQNPVDAESCFKCGRALYALTEGAVLAGRYEVVGVLGRGGMGTVYKAFDRELDEPVAVKVLRPDLLGAEDMVRRFRSEIKLARRVRHRNVCGIHEYGQEGPLRFIVMELVDGVDLRRLIKDSGAFSPAEAREIGISVAEGLEAIHDAGIIHRDLKTSNIMRDSYGVIRLMDFGIAKEWKADSTVGTTGAGKIVGTPEYMSPEQVRGEKIDYRSDIYGLGVVLFELFAGRVPFQGDTPASTLLKHLEDAAPLGGPEVAGLPPAVVTILGRALAKQPQDRYQTAGEVAQELSRVRQAASHPTTRTLDTMLQARSPGGGRTDGPLVRPRETAPGKGTVGQLFAPASPVGYALPLLWGLLTLWSYTINKVMKALAHHWEQRSLEFTQALESFARSHAPTAKAQEHAKRAFPRLYAFAGASIWTTAVVVGGLLADEYLFDQGLVSLRTVAVVLLLGGALFAASTLTFLVSAFEALKCHERHELEFFRMVLDPSGSVQIPLLDKREQQWNETQSHLVLLSIISGVIFVLPAFGVYEIQQAESGRAFLSNDLRYAYQLWATIVVVAGGVFHLWGTVFLITLLNGHFQLERNALEALTQDSRSGLASL
jgi:hypothetical protein